MLPNNGRQQPDGNFGGCGVEPQQNPYVESARLYGDLAGCFKIKLRASGFRLIYTIIDDEIVIWVVAVGKRKDEKAYETARKRIL